ncbi:MAG TPA: hypothetical protein VIK59_02070 [Verrucomicrobiae bacterium]
MTAKNEPAEPFTIEHTFEAPVAVEGGKQTLERLGEYLPKMNLVPRLRFFQSHVSLPDAGTNSRSTIERKFIYET